MYKIISVRIVARITLKEHRRGEYSPIDELLGNLMNERSSIQDIRLSILDAAEMDVPEQDKGEFQVVLGMLYDLSGQSEKAKRAFRAAREVIADEEKYKYLKLLATVMVSLYTERSTKANALYSQAKHFLYPDTKMHSFLVNKGHDLLKINFRKGLEALLDILAAVFKYALQHKKDSDRDQINIKDFQKLIEEINTFMRNNDGFKNDKYIQQCLKDFTDSLDKIIGTFKEYWSGLPNFLACKNCLDTCKNIILPQLMRHKTILAPIDPSNRPYVELPMQREGGEAENCLAWTLDAIHNRNPITVISVDDSVQEAMAQATFSSDIVAIHAHTAQDAKVPLRILAGRQGMKYNFDRSLTDVKCHLINQASIAGIVIIGEQEKDFIEYRQFFMGIPVVIITRLGPEKNRGASSISGRNTLDEDMQTLLREIGGCEVITSHDCWGDAPVTMQQLEARDIQEVEALSVNKEMDEILHQIELPRARATEYWRERIALFLPKLIKDMKDKKTYEPTEQLKVSKLIDHAFNLNLLRELDPFVDQIKEMTCFPEITHSRIEAELFLEKNKTSDAEEICLKAIEMRLESSEEVKESLKCQMVLVKVYLVQGRPNKGLEILQEVMLKHSQCQSELDEGFNRELSLEMAMLKGVLHHFQGSFAESRGAFSEVEKIYIPLLEESEPRPTENYVVARVYNAFNYFLEGDERGVEEILDEISSVFDSSIKQKRGRGLPHMLTSDASKGSYYTLVGWINLMKFMKTKSQESLKKAHRQLYQALMHYKSRNSDKNTIFSARIYALLAAADVQIWSIDKENSDTEFSREVAKETEKYLEKQGVFSGGETVDIKPSKRFKRVRKIFKVLKLHKLDHEKDNIIYILYLIYFANQESKMGRDVTTRFACSHAAEQLRRLQFAGQNRFVKKHIRPFLTQGNIWPEDRPVDLKVMQDWGVTFPLPQVHAHFVDESILHYGQMLDRKLGLGIPSPPERRAQRSRSDSITYDESLLHNDILLTTLRRRESEESTGTHNESESKGSSSGDDQEFESATHIPMVYITGDSGVGRGPFLRCMLEGVLEKYDSEPTPLRKNTWWINATSKEAWVEQLIYLTGILGIQNMNKELKEGEGRAEKGGSLEETISNCLRLIDRHVSGKWVMVIYGVNEPFELDQLRNSKGRVIQVSRSGDGVPEEREINLNPILENDSTNTNTYFGTLVRDPNSQTAYYRNREGAYDIHIPVPTIDRIRAMFNESGAHRCFGVNVYLLVANHLGADLRVSDSEIGGRFLIDDPAMSPEQERMALMPTESMDQHVVTRDEFIKRGLSCLSVEEKVLLITMALIGPIPPQFFNEPQKEKAYRELVKKGPLLGFQSQQYWIDVFPNVTKLIISNIDPSIFRVAMSRYWGELERELIEVNAGNYQEALEHVDHLADIIKEFLNDTPTNPVALSLLRIYAHAVQMLSNKFLPNINFFRLQNKFLRYVLQKLSKQVHNIDETFYNSTKKLVLGSIKSFARFYIHNGWIRAAKRMIELANKYFKNEINDHVDLKITEAIVFAFEGDVRKSIMLLTNLSDHEHVKNSRTRDAMIGEVERTYEGTYKGPLSIQQYLTLEAAYIWTIQAIMQSFMNNVPEWENAIDRGFEFYERIHPESPEQERCIQPQRELLAVFELHLQVEKRPSSKSSRYKTPKKRPGSMKTSKYLDRSPPMVYDQPISSRHELIAQAVRDDAQIYVGLSHNGIGPAGQAHVGAKEAAQQRRVVEATRCADRTLDIYTMFFGLDPEDIHIDLHQSMSEPLRQDIQSAKQRCRGMTLLWASAVLTKLNIINKARGYPKEEKEQLLDTLRAFFLLYPKFTLTPIFQKFLDAYRIFYSRHEDKTEAVQKLDNLFELMQLTLGMTHPEKDTREEAGTVMGPISYDSEAESEVSEEAASPGIITKVAKMFSSQDSDDHVPLGLSEEQEDELTHLLADDCDQYGDKLVTTMSSLERPQYEKSVPFEAPVFQRLRPQISLEAFKRYFDPPQSGNFDSGLSLQDSLRRRLEGQRLIRKRIQMITEGQRSGPINIHGAYGSGRKTVIYMACEREEVVPIFINCESPSTAADSIIQYSELFGQMSKLDQKDTRKDLSVGWENWLQRYQESSAKAPIVVVLHNLNSDHFSDDTTEEMTKIKEFALSLMTSESTCQLVTFVSDQPLILGEQFKAEQEDFEMIPYEAIFNLQDDFIEPLREYCIEQVGGWAARQLQSIFNSEEIKQLSIMQLARFLASTLLFREVIDVKQMVRENLENLSNINKEMLIQIIEKIRSGCDEALVNTQTRDLIRWINDVVLEDMLRTTRETYYTVNHFQVTIIEDIGPNEKEKRAYLLKLLLGVDTELTSEGLKVVVPREVMALLREIYPVDEQDDA